jgi:Brp/Blh family beta-carotene 15,15'-monooxygenase
MHAASIILLSWAMIGAACCFPAGGAAAASALGYALWYACFAGLVAVVGLPHGAADHRFARPRLEPWFGRAWLPVFLAGYMTLAAAMVCGWLVAPAATIGGFFLASAWHFGQEEPRLPVGPRCLRPVLRFARGGLVIWTPLVFRPGDVAGILAQVAPATAGPAVDRAVGLLTTVAWTMLPIAAVAWAMQLVVAAGRSGRLRWALLADSGLVASLVVLFAVATPLVSFPVYFCGWHSARGLRRLRRELGESWPQLAASLAPLTGTAIALIALLAWFVLGGSGWNETLLRATFVGLSAVAVPHLVLHAVTPPAAARRRTTQPLHLGSPA